MRCGWKTRILGSINFPVSVSRPRILFSAPYLIQRLSGWIQTRVTSLPFGQSKTQFTIFWKSLRSKYIFQDIGKKSKAKWKYDRKWWRRRGKVWAHPPLPPGRSPVTVMTPWWRQCCHCQPKMGPNMGENSIKWLYICRTKKGGIRYWWLSHWKHQ